MTDEQLQHKVSEPASMEEGGVASGSGTATTTSNSMRQSQCGFSLDQQPQQQEQEQEQQHDETSSVSTFMSIKRGYCHCTVRSAVLHVMVSIVLIAVASALSYFAYQFARDQEINDFEAKFQDFANEIVRSSVNNGRNSRLVLESFSRTVTSLSIFANATWPLITLPHYEVRATDYITISKAESITFCPVVPTSIREVYENYTVNNQQWIQQGIDYEYLLYDHHQQHDDDIDRATDDDYGYVVNAEGFSILHKAKPIQPFIWTHAPLTHRAVPDLSKGPYVPIWQTFPAPRNSYVVNNNLLAIAEFANLIKAAQQTGMTTLSNVFDNNFALFGNAQTIDVDPKSVLVQPIFRQVTTLMDGNNDHHPLPPDAVVGYMIVIKKWHQIFQDVLYRGAKPVDVVLKNTCHQAFTYQIHGSNAIFLGRGDLHDPRYSGKKNLEVVSPVFNSQVIHSACNYTLHVYPTREMENDYYTDWPILVVVTLLAFCTLLAVGLYLYNGMTQQNQSNRLKAQAQQEQALLRIDHARQAAAAERQLNEFIAHEVRNPLSAAMSACSFVSSAVQDLSQAAAAIVIVQQQQQSPSPKPLFSIPAPSASVSGNSQQQQKPQPLFATTTTATTSTTSQKAAPLFATTDTTPTQSLKAAPLFAIPTATTTATPQSSSSSSVAAQQQSPPAQPLFAVPTNNNNTSPPQQPQQPQQQNDQQHKQQQNEQQLATATAAVEEQKESIMEDLHIIDSSLQFINELLRNMLDVQRAAHHQLKITKAPTDVLQDILEPVDAMLYRRGKSDVQVVTDCPDGMLVLTDRLRLKQVVLNLSRNSAKFVERGFIRLKVHTTRRGTVQIWVEDTGPGIPQEKKRQLFAKFQESLDSLSQGTGLGLSLCKILMGLMGGDVWLDETYDSGLEGRPGARFIIDLQTPPLNLDDDDEEDDDKMANGGVLKRSGSGKSSGGGGSKRRMSKSITSEQQQQTLPQDLKVLFVDDDTVLRKLIVRAVRRIAPNWKTQEAASGEAALRLMDEMLRSNEEQFDLIFMDQYMASTEKQLLGTETTQALRSKGVTSKICGLSANDMANDFFAAGANAFVCKPLPAQQDTLRQVLLDLLFQTTGPSEHAPTKNHRTGNTPSLVITPATYFEDLAN